MKGGKGNNEYHINEATMIEIMNRHLELNTDQVVTGVSYYTSGLIGPKFIIKLSDNPEGESNAST